MTATPRMGRGSRRLFRRGWKLGRGDGQPLAALSSAALDHQPAIFRAHPHEETMGAGPSLSIRLERALHDVRSLVSVDFCAEKLR